MTQGLIGLVAFAAEAAEHETSKTAFVIMGAVLAAFAVLVSAVGIRAGAGNFPGSKAGRGGVMLLSIVLVAATLFTSVITA
jgi:hypothetical protein